MLRWMAGYPPWKRSLSLLTGEVLADAVRREGAPASSLNRWGWLEMKVLPVLLFDVLLEC